jgi:hypothetical protein
MPLPPVYTSILVATVGGSLSNSFVTVSEATTILTAQAFSASSWSALTDSQRDNLLVQAADAMDYLQWKGRRIYDQQALCFPRDVQYTQDIKDEMSAGNGIDYTSWPAITTIPTAIKEAQALIAFLVCYRGIVSMSSASEGIPGQDITRVSLGGMLDVAFSQTQKIPMSSLSNLVRNPEFPVYLKLRNYLTSWKSVSGRSPNLDAPRRLLPKVD